MMQTDCYQQMLDVNLHATVTSQRLNPLLMPYSASSAHLAQLQLAAALDEQRAARSRAEAAQLLQIMEMSQQHQQVPPPDDGALPPGMTFKLAVAGMQASEAVYPESQQGRWQMPSKSSTTKHSKPAARGHVSASKNIPSPTSGSDGWQHEAGEKKLGSRQTLRTYLQKLRSEDPRCIFIVRRINKLGFRSKVLLEKHYSQFGQVAQVCVAHSKVKPLPNTQGTHPRTRPGNFGLVVMRDPEAVKRILQQGTPQTVMGFEILVYRFEQHEVEKEVMDQEEEEVEGSFEPERRNYQINQEDWNRQDSSSSNGSNGSGQANAAKHAVDWRRFRDEQAAQAAAEQALRAQAAPHAQSAAQAMPGSLPADNILGRLSLQEIQELQQLGRISRSLGVPESGAAAPPGSLMLSCGDSLQGITKDPFSYTGETALQAVHFAQLQEHVGRLHGECQQKMAELSAVATAAALMQPPPAPGLVPGAPSSAGNSGLANPARTLPTSVAPWLHGAAGITAVPVLQAPLGTQLSSLGALTVLQAQQLVNAMQAQLNAGAGRGSVNFVELASAGSGLPLPPAGPVTWPPSGLLAAAAAGPVAAGAAPGVCLQGASAATSSSPGPSPAAASTNQAFSAACQQSVTPSQQAQSQQSHEDEHFVDDDYSVDFATDTLRNHLSSLKDEDPRRIFIARRINKLGFESAEIVQHHFAQYGKVRCVLVAHSKVRPWLSQTSSCRVRPGSLGIIVMEDVESVRRILALGELQIIAGHTTIVQRFSKPMYAEDLISRTKCEQQKDAYESSTATGTTDGHAKSEDSSNSTPSDPCEKSDGDGSNSGQDGSNSSQETPELYQSGFARRTLQPAPEPRRQNGMAHSARSGARNGGGPPHAKRQHA
eukprot:TRINITY_DN10106_c0_g1_i1.p1 TRINITY_DN10106_c0_g1~~TRINITY_DN10106_c0_g1_i1.p1  ORF type:complete len:879 (+),score=201.08 TRINITY_DN10106_c0_g1_i1:199-2835(+)